MLSYSLKQSRHSDQSGFPAKIIYADYRMIGTHEEHWPSEVERFVNEILKDGYTWPPIAVFQTGSDELFKTVKNNDRVELKFGEVGVADGHHRFAAIGLLGICGLLRDHYIPVQVIPAHDSSLIRNIPDSKQSAVSIAEIESRFSDPSNKFPIMTTRFSTRLKTGEWVPLRECQPDMLIEPDTLVKKGSTAP
jgi:hypothetical protein